MKHFDILTEPLSVDQCLALVKQPSAGGIAFFLGVVRNENEGRPVTLLEYEAYGSMALKQLAAIGEELEAELPGVKLAAHHRIGSLEVGDIAVVCVASAAHRGEAFRACRALIDRIKERVPIWKREHGPGRPALGGLARCSLPQSRPRVRRTPGGHAESVSAALRLSRTAKARTPNTQLAAATLYIVLNEAASISQPKIGPASSMPTWNVAVKMVTAAPRSARAGAGRRRAPPGSGTRIRDRCQLELRPRQSPSGCEH